MWCALGGGGGARPYVCSRYFGTLFFFLCTMLCFFPLYFVLCSVRGFRNLLRPVCVCVCVTR